MSYGLLESSGSSPLMLFHDDWDMIRKAIIEGDKLTGLSFFENGLVNGEEGVLRPGTGNSVYISGIPSGLFSDGLFAKMDEESRELELHEESGEYFIYARIVKVYDEEDFPNDRYTSTHKYEKQAIEFVFTSDESSDNGVRIGKVSFIYDETGNSSVEILDDHREQSYLKSRNMRPLIDYFDAMNFFEDASGKVSIRDDIEEMTDVETIDKGNFPYFFGISELSTAALKIAPPENEEAGHYSFSGGKVFIFGRDYHMPTRTSAAALEISFTLPDTDTDTEDVVLELGPEEGVFGSLAEEDETERIVFFLEITYEVIDDNINLTALSLKAVKEEEFVDLPSVEELPASPIRIKIATFSKGEDWILRDTDIHNEDLIERFNVLSCSGQDSSYFKFVPVSNYILRIENYFRNQEIVLETVGNRGSFTHSRFEAIADAGSQTIEQANIYVKHSNADKEILKIHSDSDKELSVISLNPKDWTQEMGVGIGRIHGELVELQDAFKYYPLSLPCNGATISKEDYPLFFYWAEDNPVAQRLEIVITGDTFTLPNFVTKKPFARFVFSSVGRYQEDEFERHEHGYRALSHGNYTDKFTWSAGGGAAIESKTSSSSGGEETRPKNIGFLPLIKVR